MNLDDSSVEFAKHFTLANTISSIAHAPDTTETTEIVALATKDFVGTNSVSFLLRIGAAGELLHKPIAVPLQAFTGAGAAAKAHSSLFFDQSDKPILAFGHQMREKIAQMTSFDLENGKIIDSWKFEEFLIS